MSLEQEFISWFLLAWPMVCRLVLWLVGRSVVVPLLQDINFLWKLQELHSTYKSAWVDGGVQVKHIMPKCNKTLNLKNRHIHIY